MVSAFRLNGFASGFAKKDYNFHGIDLRFDLERTSVTSTKVAFVKRFSRRNGQIWSTIGTTQGGAVLPVSPIATPNSIQEEFVATARGLLSSHQALSDPGYVL